METVQIATSTGTETRKARAACEPGLVITGERGSYVITHVASGRRVCWASIYNTNATLDNIRNAMMIASGIDVVCSTVIDWTVDGEQLPKRQCEDWIRAFGRSLAHASDGFR
jgi:hypothetical protein